MRTHHSHHRSKIQKIAGLILLAIALTIVTPVLADYTGPSNRTITEQSSCDVILLECMYVPAKGDYRERQVDSWSCSNESKPWRSYPSQPPSTGCFQDTAGYQYWEKDESVQQVTYPPATIQGVLQNCTLKNGWCTTAPQLSLSGDEPIPDYRIIGLEGTRNGEPFGCTGSTCNVSLLQGNNSFTYWALSSYTDTSLMGTLSAKVDTVKPTISATITAASGLNNWFTSPVIFKGSASDSNPGSGLAALTCTLDGIALASCASITVNSEGPHSLVFTARDNAGQTNSLTKNASIDLQAPALNISLAGTSGSNPAWYTSALLTGAASDTSSGSGLRTFEYRLDQNSWASFPGSGELPLPEGTHTVEVRATDKAGLTASSSKTFSLDSNPPSIAIDAAGTLGSNNWHITDLSLVASASDEISGVGGLEYSLNNDSWLPYTSSLDLSDGIHEISFWATDVAGLASQVNHTYQIDTQIPGIEGSLSGVTGENGWFTSNVTLSASALDPQPGSGIEAFTYTLNGSPEEPYTIPFDLPDGQHSIQLSVRDQAGLSYTVEQTVNVDTLPPTLDIQTVLPNWVKETVTLEGSTLEEGSGLSLLEISTDDGLTWQPVTGTTSWSHSWDTSKSLNGSTEVMARAIDKAGLITRTTFRTGVDNKAPTISMPASWFQWDTIDLDIQEEHSGLLEASLEISDPQGRGPSRIIALDAATFPMQFKWDRRFADGTTAPEGRYDVKLTATDNLGNTATENASITILLNLPPGPTATPIPTNLPSATPTVSYTDTATPVHTNTAVPVNTGSAIPVNTGSAIPVNTGSAIPVNTGSAIPVNTGTATVAVKRFGSTLVPQATATPKPAITSTPRATPTQNKVVEWFESIIPSQLDSATTTTEISSIGVPAPTTDSGSNVLWGATAAAVMGSLAAYALEEKRKLDEEKARQEAREAREEERREKIKDKQMAKLEAKWEQERAWEAAREAAEQKKQEQEDRYQARMEERVLTREIKEEVKRVAEEKAERERIEAQKRAEEKKESLERQAAIAVSYATLLQKENEVPPKESNWWEKTKSFVSTNIIQPIDKYIYQPYVAPVIEIKNEIQQKVAEWTNKNIYQPYIQPVIESTKQFLNDASDWIDEKKNMIQVKLASDVEDVKQSLVSAGNWINQKIYQPYIKPEVEKAKQNLIEKASLINEKVYQPYIKPLIEKTEQALKNTAASINEKIYQPYVKPIVDQAVDKAKEIIVTQVSAIKEKIVEPIKSGVDKIAEGVKDGVSWVNENIYQPILEPVVSDINKYIYKPLADKTDAWWDQYGEWVHGALDAAGLVPGFGEVADGLNGLIYLGEGRYIEASVSALAMIPLVGDLGKLGKWGVKLGTELIKEATEKVAKETAKELTEKLLTMHGVQAAKILETVNPKAAEALLNSVDTDVLDYVIEQGPEAVEAFSKWSADDLSTHGIELALRAKDDANALANVRKLIDSVPIDPKNLTKEQKELVDAIAQYSTQYPNGKQVVLGKWVDQSSGFVEVAKDTSSLHYNPHPELWKMFGELGELQDKTAWLVNQQIVQTGINKGLPFEYTLNGVPEEILESEQNAIEAIFSGATDSEVMKILKSDYLPVRMQEIQLLKQAEYKFSFDELKSSYVISRP